MRAHRIVVMALRWRGADVAQLVEQLIRNEQVTGSIPAIGSILSLRKKTICAIIKGYLSSWIRSSVG